MTLVILRRPLAADVRISYSLNLAFRYSRFSLAIWSMVTCFGHSISQARVFVQLPKPSSSILATIARARRAASGLPCGSRARELTRAATRRRTASQSRSYKWLRRRRNRRRRQRPWTVPRHRAESGWCSHPARRQCGRRRNRRPGGSCRRPDGPRRGP